MDKELKHLNKTLDTVIAEMQKIQAKIAGSQEPASMHELDSLTQLGKRYSEAVEQIALLQTNTQKKLS